MSSRVPHKRIPATTIPQKSGCAKILRARVLLECPPPTRVPRASDPRKPPQEWLPLASNKKASNKHKLALRECPTTASHRGAQQVPRNYEFPTRVPLKNAPHECPTRSAAQIAAREHPARGPDKSALLQKCLAKVLLRKCFKNSARISLRPKVTFIRNA